MSILETIASIRTYLKDNGSVSFRMLKREYQLDDDFLEEIIEELVDMQGVAVRKEKGLTWRNEVAATQEPSQHDTEHRHAYTPKHLADKILQSRSALEGERKHVTVLFADVKGSMDVAEQLDAEVWHTILDRFFEILNESVHRYEGTVNQYTGDGIMALFGAPIAHEDHAQRACYAALHMRDKLRVFADEVRLTHGVPFGVRVGVNSGEVIVGKIGDDLRMDYTAQGHTVGLAQRMEQLSESGRITLTEYTKRLVEGFFVTRDLGVGKIKGVRDAVRIFELEKIGSSRTRLDVSRSRGLTKFVGRHKEMQNLDSALANAEAGHGQVVGVVGEPGVGKSRLCHEFVEKCKNKGVPVYAAHCPAHGKNIPYIPILELYRNYFGIKGTDSAAESRQKIAGAMLLLDENLRDGLPALFDFMGVAEHASVAPQLSADKLQRQLFAVIRQVIQALADKGVTRVLYFDDMHWIDPGSDVFVEHFVEATDGHRVLMLLNFRPEYQATWMRRGHYSQLPVTPLDIDAVRDLVYSLLGDDDSLVGLAQRIVGWTGGNPFFTEEVISELIEAGHLMGERGAYRLATPIDRLEVPTNVRAVLTARIDRLSDDAKQLLQSASVIGKSFDGVLLEKMINRTSVEIAPLIETLKNGDFIYESALFPEVEYTFKHPLTHEVAYHSQLSTRRANAHVQAAQALEVLDQNKLDEQSPLIAYHWDTAGEAEQAVRWHDRAAKWIGFTDPLSATRHWNRVIELIPTFETEHETSLMGVDACANLLNFQWMTGQSREDADKTFALGRAFAESLDDPLPKSRLFGGYGVCMGTLGNFHEYKNNIQSAITLAQDAENAEYQHVWQLQMAYCDSLAGRHLEAIELCNEAIPTLPDDLKYGAAIAGQTVSSGFEMCLGMSHCAMGNFAESSDHFLKGQEICRETDSSSQLVLSFAMAAAFNILQGDAGAATQNARMAVEVGGDSQVSVVRYSIAMARGFALFANEDWENAITNLESARSIAFDEYAGRIFGAWIIGYLAEALLNVGQTNGAKKHAQMMIAFSKEGGIRSDLRPWVALSRTYIALNEQQQALEALEETLEVLEATNANGYMPIVHELYAEFSDKFNTHWNSRDEREKALLLYKKMGANGHVTRLEKLLA